MFRGLDNVCILNQFEPQSRDRCFVGIDTGLSNDFSVLTIMNEAGRVLYIERTNGENINTIANQFINILGKFNIAGGYIETNGIGQAMFDLINPKFRRLQKFTTTQDSKTIVVRALIEDIEQQNIELPSKEFYPELYKELSLYTYKLSTNGKISFTHPTGMHDDLVDGLLLANKARVSIKTNRIYIGTS